MTRQARLTRAIRRLSAMDRRKVIHVIPDRNRWVVRRERGKRAVRILADREQAVTLARSLACREDGEFVHRRDGTMQEWQVVRGGELRTVYSYEDSRRPAET